jgi:hypothetical protein
VHGLARSIVAMEPDTKKIDSAVFALMYLTYQNGRRAWKSFD